MALPRKNLKHIFSTTKKTKTLQYQQSRGRRQGRRTSRSVSSRRYNPAQKSPQARSHLRSDLIHFISKAQHNQNAPWTKMSLFQTLLLTRWLPTWAISRSFLARRIIEGLGSFLLQSRPQQVSKIAARKEPEEALQSTSTRCNQFRVTNHGTTCMLHLDSLYLEATQISKSRSLSVASTMSNNCNRKVRIILFVLLAWSHNQASRWLISGLLRARRRYLRLQCSLGAKVSQKKQPV